MPRLHFLVPGDLQTPTGGYAYDRRIIVGLRALGWTVTVHELDGSFPFPTEAALLHVDSVLACITDDSTVLIDGLAFGAMPLVAERHGARLKLIALVHHPLAEESGLPVQTVEQLRASETRALAAVRHIVATSALTKDSLRRYGVEPQRVSVIEPGTDRRLVPANVTERRRARAEPSRPIEFLCVATVTPRKGHDVLFDALAPLASLHWHLTCVGSLTRSRQTVEALRAQLARLDLADRVTFAGEVDHAALEACFNQADVFLLPARYEGYGMAVAEALAHGLPVIATRTGAIPALVGGSAGILVPPGESQPLSDALARVLTEPDLLPALAGNATIARESLPEWSDACAAMARVIEDVAGRSNLQDALQSDRV